LLLSKAAENNWIVGKGGLSNGIRFIVFNFNAPDPVKRENGSETITSDAPLPISWIGRR